MKCYYVGRILIVVGFYILGQVAIFWVDPEAIKFSLLLIGVASVFLGAATLAAWDSRKLKRSRVNKIDRVVLRVRDLATEVESPGSPEDRYRDAYEALLEEKGTTDALELELKEIGYPDAQAVSLSRLDKSRYRYIRGNTYFDENGKLTGGVAFGLLQWLREYEQALLKARCA